MDDTKSNPAPSSTPEVPAPTEPSSPAHAPAQAEAQAQSKAPVPDQSPAPTPAPEPQKTRILVIDDEVSFARMVKLNLEKSGAYEVRVENRAMGALATAREFRPDLILLDVIMPSMDGGDVSKQIKRDRLLKDTPIIFLTATVSKREAGDGGLNSGGELFLAKPVSVEALIACIQQHVRKPDSPETAQP